MEDSVNDKKIGLLIGDEWCWPAAFIEEVHRRHRGVTAELIKLGGTHLTEHCPYQVIIDRISYEIPYYRTFLKNAMLSGTTVVNNPFQSSACDRFFNTSLIAHLGFHHPRAVALPSHSYVDGIADNALRNLDYPIPWEEHIDYLGGFPVIMLPVHDNVLQRVYVLESFEELWRSYDKTGAEPMMLREYISWDKYVRCLCIGEQHVLPIRYTPGTSPAARYHLHEHYLSAEEKRLVIESAREINRTLGYDINAVDFAIKDGVVYVVDATNSAPDFDIRDLTPHLFDWVVKTMADFAIDLALRQPQPNFGLQQIIEPYQLDPSLMAVEEQRVRAGETCTLTLGHSSSSRNGRTLVGPNGYRFRG
jgi:hypothetical protein